jgi:hypothetical protein
LVERDPTRCETLWAMSRLSAALASRSARKSARSRLERGEPVVEEGRSILTGREETVEEGAPVFIIATDRRLLMVTALDRNFVVECAWNRLHGWRQYTIGLMLAERAPHLFPDGPEEGNPHCIVEWCLAMDPQLAENIVDKILNPLVPSCDEPA